MDCNEKVTKKNEQRKADRVAAGLCRSCGDPAAHERTYCQRCLDLMTAKRHGISLDRVLRLRENGCEACGSRKRLHIDHDHETGRVRGTLCSDCNQALGLVHENVVVLRGLIWYVENVVQLPAPRTKKKVRKLST